MAKDQQDNLSLLEVIKSTLMSFLGVQKGEIRQRDFEKGKPLHFIVVGLVLTIVFILILFGLVKFILYMAGI